MNEKKKAKEKNPYDTALLEWEDDDDDEKGRFVREARSNYEWSNVGQ